ncbi:hypothetical protein ACRQ5D_05380 [Mucilaginibacter sp. P25]|uniref:Uncharacterized protein n=1 Tax=Mucilaginibacter gossypii TaxID=551996 RepID=A0A1G8ERA3_9SPHI|nr:hypothetical protein [Mucilaginibacter gossypii]SDH72431.1 hypothetical protein SAMN05192573_11225 [Mucilaginibacter gossypii]
MKAKILLFVPLLFTGCITDYYDRRLSVINKSSVHVAVEVVNDTTVRTENGIPYYQSHVIAPNDTSFITKSGKNAWLEYINKGKTKTLYAYFFDIDSLNKYQKGGADMSYLLGNKKYLKRLDYTLDELKRVDWQIKYR